MAADAFPLDGPNRLKRCRHGVMLYNPNDLFVGRSLDLYGEYSEGEVDLFRQVVRPGQVVLDVGANIGPHTVFLARAVGAQGHVVAFEPQRLAFQALCANVALNGLTNVTCRDVVVGAERAAVRVPVLDPAAVQNFGGLSLTGTDEGEVVEQIALDQLALARCDFIKIDVEGMEGQVIAGAADTLRRLRPLLYVENDRKEQSDALVRRLDALGYRMYWHPPPLFNPDNYAGNPDNVFGDTVSLNILCLPRESDMEVTGMPRVGVRSSPEGHDGPS